MPSAIPRSTSAGSAASSPIISRRGGLGLMARAPQVRVAGPPAARTAKNAPPAGSRRQRMPASISGTSALIVSGVTTPEPVLIESPVRPYFFDSTHWVTGRKPCR